MLSASLLLTLALHCSPSVHPDTVLDVARTESGYNPLAIGVVGGKGRFPTDINDAVAQVEQLKAQGKNYSVGLMQINQSHFATLHQSPRQLFDPCHNLAAFSLIMTDCYRRGKTLPRALSCYYSGNFITGQKPEKPFNGTSYTERIGYVVPSTRTDRQKHPPAPPDITPLIRWPDRVVRGDVSPPGGKVSGTSLNYPARVIRGSFALTQ